MAGRMRKRAKKKGSPLSNVSKSFSSPQKDNSKRARRRAALNDHKQQKEDQ